MNRYATVNLLALEAERLWGQIIRHGENCALLDFPDHPNVGDSAIWAGERALLGRLGARVKYSCRDTTFCEGALRRTLPRGTLLLHGGGNFGTLWPDHQKFREHILDRCSDYRIIQLPQTIYFDNTEAMGVARASIARHPDFTLMVRDASSAGFARDHLGVTAIECPDSAFALAGRFRRPRPVIDCLVLARTDKEKADHSLDGKTLQGKTVETADWMDEANPPLRRISRRFKENASTVFASTSIFQQAMLAIWDRTAEERLDRGIALLARAKVVVTDRLHAHILCALLGIPNVIIDNSYGKLAGVWTAWTSNLPQCHRANSSGEAMAIAAGLLGS